MNSPLQTIKINKLISRSTQVHCILGLKRSAHTHRCIPIKFLHMYDLVLCIHLVCVCMQLISYYATMDSRHSITQCAVRAVPVWFYAWLERQMFIPQGVYSHTYAHTPGYTLFSIGAHIHIHVCYIHTVQCTCIIQPTCIL